jgi:hypothetical protein
VADKRNRRVANEQREDPAANKEKAEGSRDTVDAALEPDASAPGITNRAAEDEAEEQRQLPPRGAAKREE